MLVKIDGVNLTSKNKVFRDAPFVADKKLLGLYIDGEVFAR